MQTRKHSDEKIEAEFLQGKLTKITVDEVLDFYLAMTLAPTVSGFLGHIDNDRVCGRASNFIPVRSSRTSSHPNCKAHRPDYLLFCCASCNRAFVAEYAIDGLTGEKMKPTCPECGRNLFVDEVTE